MRCLQAICIGVLATSSLALAKSKNPADYPLRIHVFGRNQTTWYSFRQVNEAKGEGRADLFENGDVHGVDFNYACSEKLIPSFGFETYPAKWKKPNRELVVLLPTFGKTGSYFTCNFNTDVKEFVYFRGRRGGLGSESPQEYEAWMARHDYDPVHGKNLPVRTATRPVGGSGSQPAKTKAATGSE